MGTLAQLLDDGMRRAGWSIREWSEATTQWAEAHNFKKYGKTGDAPGVSRSAIHIAITRTDGVPDLENLYMMSKALQEKDIHIPLSRMLTALGMDFDADEGEDERRSRSLMLGASPNVGDLEEIAGLPPRKYRVLKALLIALRTLDDDET